MSRKIEQIFIHCTDSPDSLDIGFKEINQWHKEKGWRSHPSGISCGYHYVVRRDGRVEKGRPDSERGAHVYGHNTKSIGVVWVGKNDIDRKQYIALLDLLANLMDKYDIDVENVLGHCEKDHMKTCPNLDMLRVRGDVIFRNLTDIDAMIKDIIDGQD